MRPRFQGQSPELIARLQGMMLARGLNPKIRDGAANRANFGVKATQ